MEIIEICYHHGLQIPRKRPASVSAKPGELRVHHLSASIIQMKRRYGNER